MEYAGLIINWDELHEICKTQTSEKNRKAIRERIEFFRVDREPVTRWCNSSFKMAGRIKNAEPKKMKEFLQVVSGTFQVRQNMTMI
jgi:hypothetical protein